MRSLITHAFSREAPLHGGRKLVLIIEPHPAISHLLRFSLELAGYAVMEQADRACGFDHTRWAADPPAAILLDLSLSWDGVADLAMLHASWKDAPPILVLTTNQRLYTELAQTQRILLKPFHLHDLLLAVQKMIGSDAQECCHAPQQPGVDDATGLTIPGSAGNTSADLDAVSLPSSARVAATVRSDKSLESQSRRLDA